MKVGSPPPAPAPVDPGKSALDYINAMADPALQARLLAAEQQFRPSYAALNLQDLDQYLKGTGGQQGLLDQLAYATEQAGQIDQQAASSQRSADIADVEALGARATAALRAADPYQQQVLQNINSLAQDAFDRSGRLSPEAQRLADQQALALSAQRGRVGDNSSIAAQILNRENALSARRAEAAGYAQLALGANQATAGDPFMAILGRPSGASAIAQNQQGLAGGLFGAQGPQLFSPDAGINLALQNSANLANYNASTYGAQAGAKGAIFGGLLSGLGALGGGFAARCWVAREVYGLHNPAWLRFFIWKEFVGPAWFRDLYNRYGEAWAKFISDKPLLKRIIRNWMDRQINGHWR